MREERDKDVTGQDMPIGRRLNCAVEEITLYWQEEDGQVEQQVSKAAKE